MTRFARAPTVVPGWMKSQFGIVRPDRAAIVSAGPGPIAGGECPEPPTVRDIIVRHVITPAAHAVHYFGEPQWL